MSEMKIDDVKAEKLKLERAINQAIGNFHKRTGMSVAGVDVSHTTVRHPGIAKPQVVQSYTSVRVEL